LLLAASFLIGSIPAAQVVSRLTTGRDLRDVDTGTVSATNVYRTAGPVPFAVTAGLDLGKGALTAAIAGRLGPGFVEPAVSCMLAGHNWSPFLRGAGGRGVLPAIGALLVAYPRGAIVLAGGLVAGALAGDTAPGVFAAQAMLPPALAVGRGRRGALLGLAVIAPMLLKRLAGNHIPASGRVCWNRLVFDRDRR